MAKAGVTTPARTRWPRTLVGRPHAGRLRFADREAEHTAGQPPRVSRRVHDPRQWWTLLVLYSLALVGLILAIYVGHVAASDGFAYDAHAYWAAQGYVQVADTPDAFVYSPPILLAFRALHELPWPLFLEAYTALIAVGTWILAGPFTAFVIFTPQVASELTLGNIHVFLALVAVFGLRWPALWSFAILTKVTPGIGLLWFVFRGEWQKLAIAFGVTALIALPTMLFAPDLWIGWLDIMNRTSQGRDGLDLSVRLVIAAVIVFVGARRQWPWLVPIACMLAQPVLWSVHGLSMLLGVVWYSWANLRSAAFSQARAQ